MQQAHILIRIGRISIPSLFLILFTTCSEDRRHDIDGSGLDPAFISHARAQEKLIEKFYYKIEQDMRQDLGVSEKDVTKRIQTLIDDGYVPRPLILKITKHELEWRTVDYLEYKQFMKRKHALHGVQPVVPYDSGRRRLLELFSPDSVRLNAPGDPQPTEAP